MDDKNMSVMENRENFDQAVGDAVNIVEAILALLPGLEGGHATIEIVYVHAGLVQGVQRFQQQGDALGGSNEKERRRASEPRS
jgi:hypothetical protein